jgi:hypothetical protein
MTTYADIIRAAIPGADPALCEHILWGRTPFPVGRVTARDLYRAASAWKRAAEHGIVLCEFCHRIARAGKFTCQKCEDAFSRGDWEGA